MIEPPPASEVVDDIVVDAYLRHADHLRRLTVHHGRDRDDADDIVQDAFLRLLVETRRNGAPEVVGAWLARVSINLALSRHRHDGVVRRHVARLGPDGGPTTRAPEAITIARAELSDVVDRLAALDPDARAGILLAAAGVDGRTTAAALGRSELATRALLCRTRRRLRDDERTRSSSGRLKRSA